MVLFFRLISINLIKKKVTMKYFGAGIANIYALDNR